MKLLLLYRLPVPCTGSRCIVLLSSLMSRELGRERTWSVYCRGDGRGVQGVFQRVENWCGLAQIVVYLLRKWKVLGPAKILPLSSSLYFYFSICNHYMFCGLLNFFKKTTTTKYKLYTYIFYKYLQCIII